MDGCVSSRGRGPLAPSSVPATPADVFTFVVVVVVVGVVVVVVR